MIMIWFIGYLVVQMYTEGKGPDAEHTWMGVYFLVLGIQVFLRAINGSVP